MSTSTLSPTPAAPPRPRGLLTHRWAPLAIVLAGTFMMVLDFFIVNVALPAMQHGLHASDGAVEWVVAGYGLTTAVFLITGARIGDRCGRVRAFTGGLALFTVSSAACGLAPSAELLVVARLAQGAAAALLGPNVLAIIADRYDGPDRTRALAAYGLSMGVAAVFGQLIGGALVQADLLGLGWRMCFLINVPIGVVATVLAPRVIAESRAQQRPGLDLLGTVLATLGLTAIVLPLVDGRSAGWPLWTWLSLSAAGPLLFGFAVRQRRVADDADPARPPLVPPVLFASRTFTVGLLAQLLFWCGQGSFFLVLALYLQLGRGLSPLDAGLVFTILAGTYVVTSVIAPPLLERHGRRVLVAGALVLAAGHGALVAGLSLSGSLGALVPGLMLVGAGMGLAIAAVPALVLAATAPADYGATSGVLTTMQYVGSAIGAAALGALFYGHLAGGYASAFELCAAVLAGTLVAVAGLARLLPAPVRS